MKILLTTLNSKFIHTNLAIRYIKESIKDLIDVDLREYTINNQLDYILKDIYSRVYWSKIIIIRASNNDVHI